MLRAMTTLAVGVALYDDLNPYFHTLLLPHSSKRAPQRHALPQHINLLPHLTLHYTPLKLPLHPIVLKRLQQLPFSSKAPISNWWQPATTLQATCVNQLTPFRCVPCSNKLGRAIHRAKRLPLQVPLNPALRLRSFKSSKTNLMPNALLTIGFAMRNNCLRRKIT